MNPRLKTLLIIIITAFVVGGGVYFWQQLSTVPTETQVTDVDSIESKESMNGEMEDNFLFEGEGFSFSYSSDWTTEIKEVNQTHFYQEGTKKLVVWTFEVMGPRCVLSESRDFIDSEGRSWTYNVMRPGVPENLSEMCANKKDDQSMGRTAEILMLKDSAGNYLASLSYYYDYANLDQEKAELARFESILSSIKFSQ